MNTDAWHGVGVWHGVKHVIFTMPVKLQISNVQFSPHASHCLTCKRFLVPLCKLCTIKLVLPTTTSQPFYGPFSGAGARRELMDFMVQGKINRGRHIDHPAGCHSIRTNQCPPPPSPMFTGRMRCPSCRQTNSVKAPKD